MHLDVDMLNSTTEMSMGGGGGGGGVPVRLVELQNCSWVQCFSLTTLRVTSNQALSHCYPVEPNILTLYLPVGRVGLV